MSVDTARFLRLKSSVDVALTAFPIGQVSLAGKALTDSYNLLRAEARMSIPDGLQDEFDRMFPELDLPKSSQVNPIAAAEGANVARAKLALLAGWLDSIVEKQR